METVPQTQIPSSSIDDIEMMHGCPVGSGILGDVIPLPMYNCEPMPFLKSDGFWHMPLTTYEEGVVDNAAAGGASFSYWPELFPILEKKSCYSVYFGPFGKFQLVKKDKFRTLPHGDVPVAEEIDGSEPRVHPPIGHQIHAACVSVFSFNEENFQAYPASIGKLIKYPVGVFVSLRGYFKGEDNEVDIELGIPNENTGWANVFSERVTGILGSSYDWADEAIFKKADFFVEEVANKLDILAVPFMTEAGASIYQIHTSELRNSQFGKDLVVKNGVALSLIGSGLLFRQGQRTRLIGNAALISGVCTAAVAYLVASAY